MDATSHPLPVALGLARTWPVGLPSNCPGEGPRGLAMRTRRFQRDPEPTRPSASGNGAPPPARPQNLAHRMGRWSAQHRKKAIFGWLAFVVVALLIGMGGAPTETLVDQESGVGESGRADETVYDAFPKKADESVLIQSETLEADAPEFRAVVSDVQGRLGERRRGQERRRPVRKRERRLPGRALRPRRLRGSGRRGRDSRTGSRLRSQRSMRPRKRTLTSSSTRTAARASRRNSRKRCSTRTSRRPRSRRCRSR